MTRPFQFARLALSLAALLSAGAVFAQVDASETKLVAPAAALSVKGADALYRAMQQVREDKKLPDYSVEKLQPLEGAISLPRGWLLYEEHSDRAYGWLATLPPGAKQTRGDARMRLLLQPNVLKVEKRKPSIVVAGQVADLVKAHPDFKACEPTTVGVFTKVCYEYDQALGEPAAKFRVRSSFYYSDAMDLMAQTAFSALADKWSQYEPTMAKLDGVAFFNTEKYGTKPAAKPATKK